MTNKEHIEILRELTEDNPLRLADGQHSAIAAAIRALEAQDQRAEALNSEDQSEHIEALLSNRGLEHGDEYVRAFLTALDAAVRPVKFRVSELTRRCTEQEARIRDLEASNKRLLQVAQHASEVLATWDSYCANDLAVDEFMIGQEMNKLRAALAEGKGE